MIDSLFNGDYTLERAVALHMQGVICMSDKVLKLSNPVGFTFAHFLAQNGHIFKDPEILKLACDDGLTVAHITALNGHVFSDPRILNLSDKDGLTVRKVCMDRGIRKMNDMASMLAVMYCHRDDSDKVKTTETGQHYIAY